MNSYQLTPVKKEPEFWPEFEASVRPEFEVFQFPQIRLLLGQRKLLFLNDISNTESN